MIQSNYIPWRGYFDFINDVDLFIFYDDVQYTRKDWRNRNTILSNNGPILLTVPVIFSRNDEVNTIDSVPVDYSRDWVKKHIRSIELSYAKAPFFDLYANQFFDILKEKHEKLSTLNIEIIKLLMGLLKIDTKLAMSSDFDPVGHKTDRIIDILKKVDADHYLVGPASKSYIKPDKFQEADILLEFKTYHYVEYPQIHGGFVPKLSILDLLFNCGPKARDFLKNKESL